MSLLEYEAGKKRQIQNGKNAASYGMEIRSFRLSVSDCDIVIRAVTVHDEAAIPRQRRLRLQPSYSHW